MNDKKRSRSNGKSKEPALKKKAKITPVKSDAKKKAKVTPIKKAAAKPKAKPKPKTPAASKKEGFKSGQKFEVPGGDDSCRAFYESLHQQKPESLMAAKWCLEHGLIEDTEIKKITK